MVGSSPLTRGKPRSAHKAAGRDGLIPAHAGKTGTGAPHTHRSRAHPRSRGENDDEARDMCEEEGSSPLTRGKHRLLRMLYRARGLIPAHAGKTPAWWHRATRPWAHPRSRGENYAQAAANTKAWGSSPLTRGKLTSQYTVTIVPGLIPAHAGKTSMRSMSRWLDRAHPRSRGENVGRSRQALGYRGSSPLTRGKHVERLAHVLRLGLIPAHAGKTRGDGSRTRASRAHPRSRGENGWVDLERIADSGSSPLTRGKLVVREKNASGLGLIPAHAGKTTGGA